MDMFIEESLKTMIDREYDVIVVGGGIAGISAALAARRNGCRTLIIEKSTVLGGLATLGLIAIYLPLCDGKGRKIIGGIAEELLRLSIKYGYDNLPEEWKDGTNSSDTNLRYRTCFSPPEFIVTLDELIEAEGIDVLYDSVFCNTVVEGGICRAIIIENKSGRLAYSAKMIVDASGDADIMARGGAQCTEGENKLAYWAYSTNLEAMNKAVYEKNIMHGIKLEKIGGDFADIDVPDGPEKYTGTKGWEVSRFITESRKLLWKEISRKDRWEKSYITFPGMAQFRTTRRICGCYELTERDMYNHFEDSIGCTGDWRKAGPIYEIPYRSLISRELKNVIAAGRLIASGGDTWEVTRVIPVAALTGQAAGTAAALCVRSDVTLDALTIKELQKTLGDAGVLIHF